MTDSIEDMVDQMSEDELEEFMSLFKPRTVDAYMKETPTPAQQLALSLSDEELCWGGSAGGGKLLHVYHLLSSPVWCYDGGIRYQPIEGAPMGVEQRLLKDIAPGDYVFDQDGKPVKVLAKSPVEYEPTYRLTMLDGEEIICGERHLWTVLTDKNRIQFEHSKPEWKAKRREQRASRSVATKEGGIGSGKGGSLAAARATAEANRKRAAEARANEVDPYIWDFAQTMETRDLAILVATERKRVCIPVAQALQTNTPWPDTMLSPYYLGAWLGDGTSATGDLTQDVTTMGESSDSLWLIERLAQDGIRVESINNTKRHKVWMPDGSRPQDTLREFDLLGNKHIPEFVFSTSIEDRMTVLQGIVDTDGHINARGQLEMCLTNERLIKDVQRLMATLGLRVGISAREASYTKNGVRKVTGTRYTIKCTPDIPVASMPRKAARLVGQGSVARNAYRYIESVELLDYQPPLQCIQVDDPRGLYCVGRTNLVTHNSSYLLMAALMHVDVPGYSALLLRRTFNDLVAPGALLDRAKLWLADTDAKMRDEGRLWLFPSGAKLAFGYAQRDSDKYKFAGGEYQFLGFDELTQFDPSIYTFLFSRLRRPQLACMVCNKRLVRKMGPNGPVYSHAVRTKEEIKFQSQFGGPPCTDPLPDPQVLAKYGPAAQDGMTIFDVPLMARSATNPGGPGHEFVKKRFINPETRGKRVFIPASLRDNPNVDREAYVKALSNLSTVDRERLLNGDWDVDVEGSLFTRDNFQPLPDGNLTIGDCKEAVRYWDLAATESDTADYTVGALCGVTDDGRWVVLDIKRARLSPAKVERLVRRTAEEDGRDVRIAMEQEPGSAGKNNVSNYSRNVLPGFRFKGVRVTGKKEVRAEPLAAQVEAENVYINTGAWNSEFLTEFQSFPTGAHDDQVDAVVGAFNELVNPYKKKVKILGSF